MGDQFLGEIRLFPFDFAPRGWALCDGAILSIGNYTALFSLLGTAYGGNGVTNFALPDLRGRVPVNPVNDAAGDVIHTVTGGIGGAEGHILTSNEVPSHTHGAAAISQQASQSTPAGNIWAKTPAAAYAPSTAASLCLMNDNAVMSVGGQGHNNMQPFIVLNYCIATQGIFPSRN